MDVFWKCCAAVLIALILILALGKQERDMGTLLSIAVCCMAGLSAMEILKPVLEFLYELQNLILTDSNAVILLLQIAGIGLVAEMVSMICSDAGNASLGKAVQFLASSVILCRSVPVFQSTIDLIRQILGDL